MVPPTCQNGVVLYKYHVEQSDKTPKFELSTVEGETTELLNALSRKRNLPPPPFIGVRHHCTHTQYYTLHTYTTHITHIQHTHIYTRMPTHTPDQITHTHTGENNSGSTMSQHLFLLIYACV